MDENTEKKQILIPNVIKYFLAFLLVMVSQELLIHGFTGLTDMQAITQFVFIPAVALVFSILCGFTGKKRDRIVFYLLLGILYIFYAAQLIYHDIFGSFFSVSMVGIGPDAILNFFSTLVEELIKNLPNLLMLFLPDLVCIILDARLIKGVFMSKQSLISKGICLALIVPVWLSGVLVLRLADTGNRSAYYIYSNSLSDTDTSAGKLGVLATSVIEARAFLFGFGADGAAELIAGSDEEDLNGIEELMNEIEALSPTPEPTATPTVTLPPTKAPTASPTPSPSPTATPTEAPQSYYSWCYDEIDFTALAELATDEDIKDLCEYFATVEPTNKNEYTGLFEGYNLVYICAEAFWKYAVNEKVTPTLYKMANNGIVLPNFYNSFLNTTTNGEFAFSTGLWPDVSRKADNGRATGSFASTATNLMPFGLGNLFSEQYGAKSYGFHNYIGSYYSRNLTWPNLGYITKFMDEGDGNGGMTFTSDWITSDLEMMEQAVDDFINEDVFHAYFMTFSGHGPYTGKGNSTSMYSYNANAEKNIDMVREALGDTVTDEQALYYYAANAELDKALEYLITRLEEAGKLDKTVIVINGDHFPYYIDYSQVTKDALAGKRLDEDTEKYQSTCIIYNSGIKTPIVNNAFCCTVDILPTILNLFNLKYDSRLLAGKDVFSDSVHKAVLYNKSFITNYATYCTDKDETTWHIDTEELSEEVLKDYIESVCAMVDMEYAASLQIVNTDFYRFVWENTWPETDPLETGEETEEEQED